MDPKSSIIQSVCNSLCILSLTKAHHPYSFLAHKTNNLECKDWTGNKDAGYLDLYLWS